MNKKHITPKAIELSKEIAEYWRMEIYKGCWVCVIQVKKGGEKFNRKLIDGKTYWIDKDTQQLYWGSFGKIHENDYFPIPSISDVLKKLSGITTSIEKELLRLVTNLWRGYHTNIIEFHKALLSALLEVLKNGEIK